MLELGTKDFKIQLDEAKAVMSGVLRLPSPRSYDEYFQPIEENIAKADAFTIDLTEVTFLNSSGITAVSKLIFLAKKHDKAITFHLNPTIPWQPKTFASVAKLWEKMTLKYIE